MSYGNAIHKIHFETPWSQGAYSNYMTMQQQYYANQTNYHFLNKLSNVSDFKMFINQKKKNLI